MESQDPSIINVYYIESEFHSIFESSPSESVGADWSYLGTPPRRTIPLASLRPPEHVLVREKHCVSILGVRARPVMRSDLEIKATCIRARNYPSCSFSVRGLTRYHMSSIPTAGTQGMTSDSAEPVPDQLDCVHRNPGLYRIHDIRGMIH